MHYKIYSLRECKDMPKGQNTIHPTNQLCKAKIYKKQTS